jgi:RHS repeat-associated protein
MNESTEIRSQSVLEALSAEGALSVTMARYYNPGIGRFVSEDPIRYAGGDINFYPYIANRPVQYRDPFGLVTPLSPGEEAKCLADIERALDIVVPTINRKCCKDGFVKYGCNLDPPHLLSGSKLELAKEDDLVICTENPNTGEGPWGYRPPGGDPNSIKICPFACRMGRWAIAATIIHELYHKCIPGASSFEERSAREVEGECGFKGKGY